MPGLVTLDDGGQHVVDNITEAFKRPVSMGSQLTPHMAATVREF